MPTQQDFDTFHKYRINLGDDGLNHPFIGDKIYLHATPLANLQSILENGFLTQHSKFKGELNGQLCGVLYFHKSWKKCASFVIGTNPILNPNDYAMIAVDLSNINSGHYAIDQQDPNLVRVILSIAPQYIVGSIIIK